MAMRALIICLLLFLPASAQAMNWEGKDDWMAEIEPAVIYGKSVPNARPLPDPACPAVPEKTAEHNPYEQVPLARHGCPMAPPEPAG
jgi:hypothetical protein